MQRIVLLFGLLCMAGMVSAQNVYTINADSTKLTGCDSNELIIENHSQAVKGFLYNTGHGRTVFKPGLVRIADGIYQVGGDTLNIGMNAWLQGGNSWGANGKFGTLDNNHVDFYTRDSLRMRLSNRGSLVLGDTTDYGNTFRVNGNSAFNGSGSYAGNLNIGTATVTNTGKLIGTNALLFNYVVPRDHNYRSSDPYIGRLENVIYAYNTRLGTTYDTSGGVYTIHMVFPPHEIVPGYAGLVYGQGFFTCSFWSGGFPQSVSIMLKDSLGNNWVGPYTSSTNIGDGGAGFFQVQIGFCNWITEIKVIMTPQPGAPVLSINLQDMEYLPSNTQGLASPNAYVSKDSYEYLYYPLKFSSGGFDNLLLNPWGASYFGNNLLLGTSSDNSSGAKLQVAGDITSTGSMTISGGLNAGGYVRCAGLTNNNSQTRVLVSDVNGYLYYRDASTLATDDIPRSSLVVNGPVKAKTLILGAPDSWPDYVFDSSYTSPDLRETERYIRDHHHLPGIVSSKEVTEKGLNVAEHEAALLKKIEELTLVTIGQDKKMQTQHAEIQILKDRISALEKFIITKNKTDDK